MSKTPAPRDWARDRVWPYSLHSTLLLTRALWQKSLNKKGIGCHLGCSLSLILAQSSSSGSKRCDEEHSKRVQREVLPPASQAMVFSGLTAWVNERENKLTTADGFAPLQHHPWLTRVEYLHLKSPTVLSYSSSPTTDVKLPMWGLGK
jgi:hypothetical protein